MVESLQNAGHKWHQVLDPITRCHYHEHGNWQGCEILLKLEVSVHREKYVKPRLCQCKQLPVFDSGPSAALNGGNLMANE